MSDPTPAQLSIARRVGNRLSERMPPQGVMDWTDVQQFALEALLGLIAEGNVPEEPAHLGNSIRLGTIDLLRKHGVLVRLTDGSYTQAEAPELDALPDWMRDAIVADDAAPSQREPTVTAPGRKELDRLTRTPALAERGYRARKGVSGELTEREIEVLAHIADGWSYEQTAEHLGIGRDTVSNHLARGRLALRARGSSHAVAIAFRRGLLS